jgi:hypothetical protein
MYQIKEKAVFEDEIKTYFKNRHLGIEGDKLAFCKTDAVSRTTTLSELAHLGRGKRLR